MRLPLGLRRTLHNIFQPSIFPALGGPDVLRVLEGVSKDGSIVTWEWATELALRHHYNHLFMLTLRHVFRVRPNMQFAFFDTPEALGAPPPAAVLAYGRLNEAGQSRFYAADNPVTAILETRPRVGDILTLTMYGFRNYSSAMRRSALIAGMAKYRSPNAEIEIGDVRQRYESFKSTVEDFERFLAVDSWIGDTITRQVADDQLTNYYPTIALGNMVLGDFGFRNASGFPGARADALLYPSVATQLRAMNVCMEPETAVATYSPERAWKLKFEGVDLSSAPPRAKITPISQTMLIDHTGKIEWGEVDMSATRSIFADALSTKAAVDFL